MSFLLRCAGDLGHSLESHVILERLCALVQQRLAKWCSIELIDPATQELRLAACAPACLPARRVSNDSCGPILQSPLHPTFSALFPRRLEDSPDVALAFASRVPLLLQCDGEYPELNSSDFLALLQTQCLVPLRTALGCHLGVMRLAFFSHGEPEFNKLRFLKLADELSKLASQALANSLFVEKERGLALGLSQSLLQLENFMEILPVGIGFLDTQMRFAKINEVLSALFDVNAKSCLGKTLLESVPTLAPVLLPHVQGVLNTGWALSDLAITYENPNSGDERHCQVSFFPLKNALGKVTGVGILAEDAALQHQHQKNLRKAIQHSEAGFRARNEFISLVSQEIRTPLVSVLGLSELLLNPEQSFAERLQCVTTMRRNGEDLLQLIDDMLELSKEEHSSFEVQCLSFAPASLVQEVVEFFNPQAVRKGLEIRVALGKDVPALVSSDPVRFRQILLSLLGNALRHTSFGSITVALSFVPEGKNADLPKLKCVVSDTGPGLSRDVQESLFGPFSSGDGIYRRQSHEPGAIGLALSRKLARALGGDLQVDAHQCGVGTHFVLTIDAGLNGLKSASLPHPSWAELSTSAVTSATLANALAVQAVRLDGVRVLVVDDADDNLLLVSRFLCLAGAHVECANDGCEGVDLALRGEFDLVLMDLQMPKLNGFEAAKRLRKLGFQKPIIALTACAQKDDGQRCLAAGCNEHLIKPVSRSTLLRRVAHYTNTLLPLKN